MSPGTETLTRSAPCPRCGWEHRTVDAAEGLHIINRRCQRGACRGWFWAVFRGDDLVDTVPADGPDESSLRESLARTPLTPDEQEHVVSMAQNGNGSAA